jgi:hypothetical protein
MGSIKMRRYKLKPEIVDNSSPVKVYASINPSRIENSKILDKSESYFEKFFPENASFKGMFPSYGESPLLPEEVHALSDMHSWIEKEPRAFTYPVSARFKNLLTEFNIPDVRFYPGTVVWSGDEYEYHVMHVLTVEHKYIDFKNSRFVKSNAKGDKKPSEVVSGDDMNEIYDKLGSHLITFERAVMLPEFRNIDMYFFHSILITEQLKNEIQKANLSGVNISECPIDFEFSDEI